MISLGGPYKLFQSSCGQESRKMTTIKTRLSQNSVASGDDRCLLKFERSFGIASEVKQRAVAKSNGQFALEVHQQRAGGATS